jgi:3-keto-disaccharide hydrolase
VVEPKLKYAVTPRLDSLRCPDCRREAAAREERTDRDRQRLKRRCFHGQTVSAGAADCQNSLAVGWTATQTGTGAAAWTVVQDSAAPSKPNVLKQSGAATYPVGLKDDSKIKDGFVEVKFKPLSGKEDQAGGLVWRAKDANNYDIARANALEDKVTIYHTINGRRPEKKRTNVKVAPNAWHNLRVDFQGGHVTVIFDGKKAIDWDDETFKDAGKVGVWTKADSVTLFDDFSYSAK